MDEETLLVSKEAIEDDPDENLGVLGILKN